MVSTNKQQCDGVLTARQSEDVPAAAAAGNVSPTVPTQAMVLVPSAPMNMNQHSLVQADRGIVLSPRGMPFDGMSTESSLVVFEEYKHGDSDCLALRYHGDGLDVIFSIHGGAGGAFKCAKFIVIRGGAKDQAPITRLFTVDLSERAHKWMRGFIGQIMERMPGDTSGQMYATVSTFYSIWSNAVQPPPPLINCDPTGQSTFITNFTMNENFLDEYPPWNKLPLDCWRLVRDRLDAFATLSFPLVCQSWAQLYVENPRLQPGAPTLLTSPSLDGGWDHPDEGHRGIFFVQNIVSSRETFFVEVDSFRYSRWIGGKDQWLVTADGCGSFKLLNPITGTCIPLVPEDVRAWHYITRIQLCQTPDEANGYFAIGIASNQLSYTMAGSDQWFLLENPCERYYMMMYTDAVLHRGKIVATCSNGDLWSWDLDKQGENPKLLFRSTIYSAELGLRRDFILAPSLNNDNLLIVSPYGEDLIRGVGNMNTFRNQWNFCVHGVAIHEVDIDAESVEDVHGIGDRALFLGPNYPFYVPVSGPDGDLKTNHVYITDISDYDVLAINLSEDNIRDKVTLMYYNGPASNPYQVPMWFRPAFPTKLG